MALVTDKFRIYAAESFRDTLLSTNRVYMFIGRAKSWGTPDSPPANEPIDSLFLGLIGLILSILLVELEKYIQCTNQTIHHQKQLLTDLLDYLTQTIM